MLRRCAFAGTFLVTSLAACVDKPNGGQPRHEAERAPNLADACERGIVGAVIYDPHFHTAVRPPHAGTFLAPTVQVGDRIAPRAVLAEIAWGPNRGKITSPVGGVVVHAGAAIGGYLHEYDVPFVVADPTRLAVRVTDAPSAIRKGAALAIDIEDIDETFAGHAGVIDGRGVIITLPAGASARIGATAHVRVNCS